MLDFMIEKQSVWEIIEHTAKPIVLYGMGNGADKILDWCEVHNVKVQGVFASDEFVRGQQFRGFTVERYDAIKARLGKDLLVVIAFASESEPVLARFRELTAEQEVVAPHLSLFGEEETVSLAWLVKHETELQQVYTQLADDTSRKVFADTVNYKLSGKISYLFDCATQRTDDLKNIFTWSNTETYLDLGAYNGDTIQEFGVLTDYKWQKILAVEPDRRNCRKLRALAESLQDRGLAIEVFESGIWNEIGALSFSDSGGRQSTFLGVQKKTVPVTTIDALVGNSTVNYIKMDVEGAEVQAITGGKHAISREKPKMFIAAYHYDVDLFRLPLLLWQLVPDYKIYLRKHPYVPAWELNFLCHI